MVEGFITGLHKSPYHGFSVEFAEHRLYNPGESTRHIDWKVFARTDKLFVKRYEEETNLRCRIILDNSSSMYYPAKNNDKITFSIMAAASVAPFLSSKMIQGRVRNSIIFGIGVIIYPIVSVHGEASFALPLAARSREISSSR